MSCRWFPVVVFMLAVPALGAGSGCDSTSEVPAPLTIETFPAAFGTSVCKAMQRCPRPNFVSSVFAAFASADLEACAAETASFIPFAIDAFVSSGRIDFDGAKARACVERLERDCDSWPDMPAECREALRGRVEAGGGCDDALECAGDAYCNKGHNPWICGGVCTLRVARGQACSTDEDCAQTQGPSRCDSVARVCMAYDPGPVVGPGQSCGFFQGEDGLVGARCRTGLDCVTLEPGGTPVCLAPLPDGADCPERGPRCALGLVCQDLGPGPKCRPHGVANVAGMTCNEQDNTKALVFCNPFKRLICNGSGVCEVTDGTAGALCDNVMLVRPCAAGFYCDNEAGVCKTKQRGATRCTSGEQCESGYCDDMEGFCAPLVCD